MAGNDPQKQLLCLIRDFATEKSQGERRIVNLKKRIEELKLEIKETNTELEEAKHCKETIEQEFKGYEVELTLNDSSIQAVEARITWIQYEITLVGSDLESLKNEGGVKRDDFIKEMFVLNARIRKFQESVTSALYKEDCNGTRSRNGVLEDVNADDAEVAKRDLENKLVQIISDTNLEKQEYETEKNFHELVHQELSDLECKASLLERIMKVKTELQELTKQTSQFEEMCASLGDELQSRLLCPSCHQDNSEALGGLLQTSD